MRKILGGAFVVAALLLAGSSSALGMIAVLDHRPAFPSDPGTDQSFRGDDAARVILAGPPSWAPAHGFRRKPGKDKDAEVHIHHHHHQDDDRVRVALPDVGIDRGFCNRELIGGILGGVAGGAIGSQIGRGDGRTVATIGGAIAGVLIGGTIGRRMDEADHACVAHALVQAPTRHAVAWRGPEGERYRVIPLAAAYKDLRGRTCRDFQAIALLDGVERSERGTACRRSNGAWFQES
ncbi:MAG TPA: glycine zipper 2TM domain-containing protein [Geminicoccaceae bacterium]